MNHFQMDDRSDTESRVMQAGTAAFGLYARCGVWVSRNLTDGFVPVEVAGMYGTREWIDKLVATGLWSLVDGGFGMPDYLEGHGNWSAERIVAHRAAAAERKARSRSRQSFNQDDEMSRRDSRVSHRESHARVTVPHTHPINTTTTTSPSSAGADDAAADPKPKGKRRAKTRVVPERFDDFWKLYPRRVGKIAAEQAFAKAVEAGADPQAIVDGALVYAFKRKGQDPEFTAHPTTWLNQGRWEDESAPPPTAPSALETCPVHRLPMPCRGCRADAIADDENDPWSTPADDPDYEPPF